MSDKNESFEEFKKWKNQYRSKENFDRLEDHMMADMLLYSLWNYRDEQEKEKLQAVEERERILRQAVEFYAEIDHWNFDKTDNVRSVISIVDLDEDNWGGIKARQALEKLSEVGND